MKTRKHSGSSRRSEDRGLSQRQLRVGESVRHVLSAVLDRGAFRDPDLADVSITVTEVEMSPNLRVATAHVMPLGGAESGNIVAALNRAAPAIRRLIAPSTTLKFLPTVRFALDTTFDQADRIEALLAQARRTPAADPDGTDGS